MTPRAWAWRGLRGAPALVGLALAACEPAPADVREWTAADHRQPPGPGQGPGKRSRQVAGNDDQAVAEQNLGDLTWAKRCATCHGGAGRGDGPQGPMVRAPDLSKADWQASVQDADIERVIRKGKGEKMPAFELSDAQVRALVARVRRFGAR